MFLNGLKEFLAPHVTNFRGKKMERKILVFESDDWGCVRMESKESFNALKSAGFDVHKSCYNTYDGLENRQDLEGLLNVLDAHKDKNGNPAVFTPNMVVANPDFQKIKESGFSRYYYKTFDVSYIEKGEDLMDVWQKSVADNLMAPQFHAREHLNPNLWLKALRANDDVTMAAFNHNFFGLKTNAKKFGTRTFMAAYDVVGKEELKRLDTIINEGLDIFEGKLGYRAKSFIACNYIWPSSIEPTLKAQGIDYIQSRRIQSVPVAGSGGYKYGKTAHYSGEKNKHGQLYTVRNCYFEPTSEPGLDWVNNCLKEISIAFAYGVPAVVSCHRINFIGSLEPANRDKGLKLLDTLLKKVSAKWPDVEFLSSEKLGDLLNKQ